MIVGVFCKYLHQYAPMLSNVITLRELRGCRSAQAEVCLQVSDTSRFVQCGEASSVGRLEPLDGDWSNWTCLRTGGGTVLKAVQDGAVHGESVKCKDLPRALTATACRTNAPILIMHACMPHAWPDIVKPWLR